MEEYDDFDAIDFNISKEGAGSRDPLHPDTCAHQGIQQREDRRVLVRSQQDDQHGSNM